MMAHAEESVTIERPVGTVFAFILEGVNHPQWRPSVIDIQQVPGTPAGVGARYTQRIRGPGGRRIAGDYEIIACQKNALITFQVTAGPARPTGTYRFEALGGATRVTFTLDHAPLGLARLMAPMVARAMRDEVAALTNLKTIFERQTMAHTKKHWRDRPPAQRMFLVLVGCIQAALLVAALADIRRRPASEIKGSNRLWTALAFLNTIGPIAYFAFGRQPPSADSVAPE
jgi:hypothetical protein